ADYDENKIEDDINEVKDNLKKTYKGAVDVGKIEDAARDIRTYFNVLNLNEYCYTARSARKLYKKLDEKVQNKKNDYKCFSEQDVAWKLLGHKFGASSLRYNCGNYSHELDVKYATKGNGKYNYTILKDGKSLKNKFKRLVSRLIYDIKGMEVDGDTQENMVEAMIGEKRYENISALVKQKEIMKDLNHQINKIRLKAEADEEITENELKLSKVNDMINQIPIGQVPVCGIPDTKDANGNSTEKEEYWAMTKILNEKAKEMYKDLDLKFEDEDDDDVEADDIEDAVKNLIGKIKKVDKKGKEM
ncbi:MAG: hypothetical protein IJS10_03835, partial [Alphaproteobacteria bacterium]|nr:hypothetical protein [Alphaproteobacteria bacterium]